MVFDEFVRPWRQTRAFTFNLRADMESLCIRKFIYCLKKKKTNLETCGKLNRSVTHRSLQFVDLYKRFAINLEFPTLFIA